MGKNCSHLVDHFTNHIFQKFGENEELGLVFYRYDVLCSQRKTSSCSMEVTVQGDKRRFFVPAKQP